MNKPSFLTQALRGGAVLAVSVAAAFLAACSPSSEVELHLERAMTSSSLPGLVWQVACAAPSTGPRACTVQFKEGTELPPTTVALPPSTEDFPASFRFQHRYLEFRGWYVELTTELAPSQLPAQVATARLDADLMRAYQAAQLKLGDEFVKKRAAYVNSQSY